MTTTTRDRDRRLEHGDEPAPDGALHHPWSLVARREVATKLVDRTFLVGTLLTMAMIVAFVVVQAVLSDRVHDYDVAATAAAAPMADAVATQAHHLDDGVRVTVVPVADDAAAQAALRDEDADAWLTQRDGGWVLLGRDDVPSDLETVTRIARSMVGRWGMSEKVGRLSVLPAEGDPRMAGVSDALLDAVDEEIRRITDDR